MKLTQLIIDRIMDSRTLPGKLRDALGVSRITIWRYLKENHPALTQAAPLKIIREETGLSDSEILEDVPELKKAS